jgi:hypothetical protein
VVEPREPDPSPLDAREDERHDLEGVAGDRDQDDEEDEIDLQRVAHAVDPCAHCRPEPHRALSGEYYGSCLGGIATQVALAVNVSRRPSRISPTPERTKHGCRRSQMPSARSSLLKGFGVVEDMRPGGSMTRDEHPVPVPPGAVYVSLVHRYIVISRSSGRPGGGAAPVARRSGFLLRDVSARSETAC